MKRVCALVIVICILAAVPVFSEYTYTPYDPLEFPPWTHELRRGQIIFFGALPLAIGAVSLILPQFYEDEVPDKDRIIAAVSISAVFSLADYIIGRISR